MRYSSTRNSKIHKCAAEKMIIIIDAMCVRCCVSSYSFSVYLLHYAYIVIITTVLVTTPCSRRPDRKKFLVCRQESKSVCLNCLTIRATRTCTQTMHKEQERETKRFIYLYHSRFSHQPVFDNYRLIFSMQKMQTARDTIQIESFTIIALIRFRWIRCAVVCYFSF